MRNRRNFLSLSLSAGVAAGLLTSRAKAFAAPGGPSPQLLVKARQALMSHGDRVAHTDLMGIADFTQPSHVPRFHILNLTDGRSESFLVAHGKGSDLNHTGWLQRFSNAPGSEATSEGSYLTGNTYVGKHGLSRRLDGLDPQNSNAFSRAIVIHGAWYVSPDMVATTGKLGRSQGCLAFSEADRQRVMDRLGAGRLIYAGRA
ncbi:murein L,D-transpeptidase catalytic domain family protein [Asticcacaulis sp.]|uniref:murein L,D-transpeptidase catalytic domain family protein n=1 Tax=Asticcacaulis sp. TaxID=1872648 RepID=UPI002B906E87|nr:murein L,D-transpeptidase catalytic domain family protein [Asticcacaulis sp.]HTM81106.1 murein L,D-transpeptidase catalytic domain family protein [Asticcacaulis sp.]